MLFGANVANNQPVTTKYLHHAKANGAEVAVVNTFREPGLERYWVPSIPSSAMFGTAIADHWFHVHTGGDLAFLLGVLRALVESNGIDDAFVREQTVGFDEARAAALDTEWGTLERHSGTSRGQMYALARLLVDRPNAILVWSMGLTQHTHGVETIRALVNVGLARGLPGRPFRGLVPIRGHSGVQGGAEVGCVPSIDPATADRWRAVWGFPVPAQRGWTAAEMVDRAAAGDVDAFWMVGGNFLETLPDPTASRRALERPRLRVHHDIVLSSAMFVESAGDVVLLPAATRYESEGGGTETTTERRIVFSPEIPGRRIGSARPEWRAFTDVISRVHPERAAQIGFESAAAIRSEIARAVPMYRGIETLAAKGDQIQWGGRTLFADGRFATPDGKARFSVVRLKPDTTDEDAVPDEHATVASGVSRTFRLSTRRGKQFNSMIQREIDPLTGASRDAVFISPDDLARLNFADGDRVRLQSPHGCYSGRLKSAPMTPGNLEVHWPEGNVLLSATAIDRESMEPDYNTTVTIAAAAGIADTST